MNPEKPESKPWVSGGPNEKYEDTLVGSRSGLETLRKHIDEALASGFSEIKDPGIEWMRIVVTEDDPRPKNDHMRWKGWLIFALIIFVFVAGVIQVSTWLK